MIIYLYLSLIIFNGINCVTYDQNTFFVNSAVLGNSYEGSTSNQMIYWNFTSTDITFKIVSKTTGWLGFGLSPNGGMKNSDMILTWSNSDGTTEFKDAHTEGSTTIYYDSVQNWQKLYYSQANGMTTVIFTRKLKVCNPNQPTQEININVEPTSYVIWAWGNGEPSYHGSNRGSKSLPLLGAMNQKINLDMSQVEIYKYETKTQLPAQRTTYFCDMFKLPDDFEQTKRHIIRYDTKYKPEQAKNVHHWVFYQCSPEFESIYLRNHSLPSPGICSGTEGSTPEWGEVEKYCQEGTLAWATGGDNEQYIPENLGYPVGGSPKEFKYFYVQWHLENSALESGIEIEASLSLVFTQKYRPIEFGTFGVGALVHPAGLTIPPNSKKLNMEYLCRKNSINAWLGDNEEITIFAQLPHTHNTGISLYSKLVRDGKEIEYIANNKYYDNEYQYINFLQTPVIVKKNDEILASCIYNTEGYKNFVVGGLGTKEEMCLEQFWYYPRNEGLSGVSGCVDFVGAEEWYNFFNKLNQTGQIDWQWRNNNTFFDDSLKCIEDSSLMDNPEKLENMFQTFYDNARRTGLGPTGYQSHDPISLERMNTDDCSTTATTTTGDLFSSADRNAYIISVMTFCFVLVRMFRY